MINTFETQRRLMVERQLQCRGIGDKKVLEAMSRVPREKFVSFGERDQSYHDGPLSIGSGQTISQPYIVAYMTELLQLQGREKVLEIGTGCGYQTAVLAEIVNCVYTIEILPELGQEAHELLLRDLDYTNIKFKVANGKDGWLDFAPFDRILITAAPQVFPEQLFSQLKEGGIAVAPVGSFYQKIIRYYKNEEGIKEEPLISVSFVPFL